MNQTEGVFVSYTAMQHFSDIIEILVKEKICFPHRFVLSAEGGLAMCWIVPGFYADIEIFNTGEVVSIIEHITDVNVSDSSDIFEIYVRSKSSIIDGLHKIHDNLIYALP